MKTQTLNEFINSLSEKERICAAEYLESHAEEIQERAFIDLLITGCYTVPIITNCEKKNDELWDLKKK